MNIDETQYQNQVLEFGEWVTISTSDTRREAELRFESDTDDNPEESYRVIEINTIMFKMHDSD